VFQPPFHVPQLTPVNQALLRSFDGIYETEPPGATVTDLAVLYCRYPRNASEAPRMAFSPIAIVAGEPSQLADMLLDTVMTIHSGMPAEDSARPETKPDLHDIAHDGPDTEDDAYDLEDDDWEPGGDDWEPDEDHDWDVDPEHWQEPDCDDLGE
jgi:hypothetical protein